MDVLTIRERAKRLRNQEEIEVKEKVPAGTDTLTAAERQIRHLDELKRKNSLLNPPATFASKKISEEYLQIPEETPSVKLPGLRRRNRKEQVKQKNIQLRLDQIRSLREYAYHSGDINGNQLNESQLCRVALDLFFWIKLNPANIQSETQLLEAAKRHIRKDLDL